MIEPAPHCGTENRHRILHEANVRAEGDDFFGLDFVSVDKSAPTRLVVTFIGKAPLCGLTENNVVIKKCGGRPFAGKIVSVTMAPADEAHDDQMIVTVDRPGDGSVYTLEVVDDASKDDGKRPLPPGFEQRYSRVDFRFRPECAGDFDCKPPSECAPPVYVDPDINYLAKDYESFKRLMLDRLSILMPSWTERHEADIGIALVEVLAYVGDHLSYYQDAVATEAYLRTARLRTSVRRHARLVDYPMHDGCNARAWVHLHTPRDTSLYADDLTLLTGTKSDRQQPFRPIYEEDVDQLPPDSFEAFKPVVLTAADQPINIAPDDMIDPGLFLQELLASIDKTPPLPKALADFVHEHADELAGATQANPVSEDLVKQLAETLTTIVHAEPIFDGAPARDAEAYPRWLQLRPETRSLALAKRSRRQSQRLNRWILEDLFPDAVASPRRLHLYKAQNEIRFYTWGEDECCLPKGSTSATLCADWRDGDDLPADDSTLHLRVGDVLIFEEIKGPATSLKADANPAHRHAVRLTSVTETRDHLFGDRPLLAIEWHGDDALPFALCLSAVVPEIVDKFGKKQTCTLVRNISVARGNIVLVDHGYWILPAEMLPEVPVIAERVQCDGQTAVPQSLRADLYRPVLKRQPLTNAAALTKDDLQTPAARALQQRPEQALPQIRLAQVSSARNPEGDIWRVRRDLIESGPRDAHFVVETENDGTARLRFGDGALGRTPSPNSHFVARYRIGTGLRGNVGADTITRVVLALGAGAGAGLQARNPLAAAGGVEPEPLDVVRELAPFAFQAVPMRAITADDYARLAKSHPQLKDRVQDAVAVLRWTGSWYEVVVAIDPRGATDPAPDLLSDVKSILNQYRRIGHAVDVRPARYVPLAITVTACVKPGYFRGHVASALLEIFSNRQFFHPDNLTFGQGISVSRIVAVAQDVEGVESVTVGVRRLDATQEIHDGFLQIDRLEIARCDNDRDRPENGTFTLIMKGGR